MPMSDRHSRLCGCRCARVALRIETPLRVERAAGLERLEDLQGGLLFEHDACRLGNEGDRVIVRVLAATACVILEEHDALQELVFDLGVDRADHSLVFIRDFSVLLGMLAHFVELLWEAGLENLRHLHLGRFLRGERSAAFVHVLRESDDEAA